METTPRCCAVTGSTGYVGSRIAGYLGARGWKVFELTRRAGPHLASGRRHVPFQLGSPIAPEVFRDNGIRVLVHCAYDFRPVKWEEIHRVNVEGSARLFQAAHEGGVDRILFISSISAFDGCHSLYGKAKLAIEELAATVGGCIIRSGLVYGSDAPGGMFGALQRSVAKSAVVPLIGSGKYVQYLVHEEDLCELVLKLCWEETVLPDAPIVAASHRAWTFRDLLQAMAAVQHKHVHFLPLPWSAVWLVLRISELLGVRARFRSDSVISLVRQSQSPDFSVGNKMGYRFREFQSYLQGVPSAGRSETPRGGTSERIGQQ